MMVYFFTYNFSIMLYSKDSYKNEDSVDAPSGVYSYAHDRDIFVRLRLKR